MLPALSFAPRRAIPRRVIAGVAGAVLVIASLGSAILSSSVGSPEANASRTLTDRLAASTWAFAVPTAWLAAPLPEVHPGDSVDLLAVRVGDRPLAVAIAADLRVMGVDDRSVVFEVDEEGATAIATARASGLLIVPLLRSTR
jgi:hypothetical protein